MRSLKFWTTTFLIFGLFLLMGTPVLMVRKPPSSALEQDRLRFAAMVTGYAILLLLVFFVTIILAYKLMVRQREEFREASLNNLKDLVEGAMQDHGRSPEEPPQS